MPDGGIACEACAPSNPVARRIKSVPGRDLAGFYCAASDRELTSELVPHFAGCFGIRRAPNRNEPVPAIFLPPAAARRSETTDHRVRRLFGLQPSRARLTALLMTRRTVEEAAIVLGITEASARQYLRQIFKKTSARRQASLIRIAGHAFMQTC
jgi:DNA-binding CsgD family transcriptional regulator